jgi:hypothetical protein
MWKRWIYSRILSVLEAKASLLLVITIRNNDNVDSLGTYWQIDTAIVNHYINQVIISLSALSRNAVVARKP